MWHANIFPGCISYKSPHTIIMMHLQSSNLLIKSYQMNLTLLTQKIDVNILLFSLFLFVWFFPKTIIIELTSWNLFQYEESHIITMYLQSSNLPTYSKQHIISFLFLALYNITTQRLHYDYLIILNIMSTIYTNKQPNEFTLLTFLRLGDVIFAKL